LGLSKQQAGAWRVPVVSWNTRRPRL